MCMKQISSVTTINPKATASKISTLPIVVGVAGLKACQRDKALARLEQAASPIEVTTRVIDSVSTLIPSVEKIHDHDFNTVGFKITDADPDKLQQAYNQVLTSMVPLPTTNIEQRIAMLATLIVLPNTLTAKMMTTKTKALAAELSEYPADIVIYAFKEVTKTATFWPSFAEFYKHMSPIYRTRKLLCDKLHKCIVNGR